MYSIRGVANAAPLPAIYISMSLNVYSPSFDDFVNLVEIQE
jgi:hypothetical protein